MILNQKNQPGVTQLHVVFKTHLDLGFTDLAKNVVALYLDDYLPRALALAEATRARGRADRFIWTVGSWLIWEFLEQKSGDARRRMERAIEHGDIAWHALPFTMHSELLDASLFRHDLSLSQRLDARFGKKNDRGQRDRCSRTHPGHCSSSGRSGSQTASHRRQPTSALPRVPPVFRWKSPDGAEVVVIPINEFNRQPLHQSDGT